ncbi:MAG: carboxypeptidase-like regulatory domain-containing protein, partial [Actinomycetota bacterium]|nr:carboxypeptidase-like regulatory domain-containing protein [Actinomycetota bacterium]
MRMQSFDGVTVSGHVLDSAGHPAADCPVGIEALTPNIGLWELDASSNSDGYWSRPVPSNASYEFQASYRGSNDKHQAATRVDVGATDVDGVDIILPGADQAWA